MGIRKEGKKMKRNQIIDLIMLRDVNSQHCRESRESGAVPKIGIVHSGIVDANSQPKRTCRESQKSGAVPNKPAGLQLLFILFLIAISFTSYSQTSSQLNQFLIMAADNNQQLQARYYEYQAILERAKISGAFPDPELSFGYLVYPRDLMPGMITLEASFMQMIPLFGMLRTRSSEVASRAERSFLLLQQARFNLFRDVKTAYYQVYRSDKEIEIMQRNLQLMETMERVIQSGIEAGMGSMVDWLRIRMQIREMLVDIEDMRQMRQAQVAELNALLNRGLQEDVSVPDTLFAVSVTRQVQEMMDTLNLRSPQLLAMDAETQAAESMRRMARIEGLPDVGIGMQYMRMQTAGITTPGQMGMVMPMVSARIPLNRSRVRSLTREADYEIEMVKSERRNMQNMLQAEFSMIMADYQSSERKVVLLRENVEQAQQAFRILLDRYMVDRVMFDDLLTIQQQLLDYEIKLQQAIVQQNTAVARLESLIGMEL
jgi:outer membrane protein, heavy metal efflux system